MDKTFQPAKFEDLIYAFWESNGLFTAKVDKNKNPFSIILPPPNANADLHLGHALYVYEDIMIRYHKLKGDEVLWLPGADHAGIETQFVFEKQLKKEGKSRLDFDRQTLFQMIFEFVEKNRGAMEKQLRRLGFALDWSKEKYTMDPDIIQIVYQTFKDLFDQDLIYRANRLVNYCTFCGTSYSDLEVHDKPTEGILYSIKFPIKGGGFIPIATTRPETLLGDVAVMVNPKDKRYKEYIGKTVVLPLVSREIPIIADSYVDMKFGTGAVKVTPSHDFNDFEVGKRHNLSYPPIIAFSGQIQNTNTKYDGLYVKQARKQIVEDLKNQELLIEEKKHPMVLKTCYKCGNTLEPLPLDQWFVKIRPLADQAITLVKNEKVTLIPTRHKKQLIRWYENFYDWNISRQNVWGIQIPAYYCQLKVKNEKLKVWFVSVEKPEKCEICEGDDFVQDEDTFDTWFSSSQWPFATLMTQGKEIYEYFYPTSVMETGYDILPWWVARMIMIGYFKTKVAPFKNVFLHGMLRDKHGKKMSKSRGNVVNPMEKVDQYGADAWRATLIFGVKEGADVAISDEKIVGMRNFANKIWNIGRFMYMNSPNRHSGEHSDSRIDSGQARMTEIKKLKKEFQTTQKKYMAHMEKYRFSKALGEVYEFLWHRFADYYIEELKLELQNGNINAYQALEEVYFENLKMLHPFMPFVTEAIWQIFKGDKESILKTKF